MSECTDLLDAITVHIQSDCTSESDEEVLQSCNDKNAQSCNDTQFCDKDAQVRSDEDLQSRAQVCREDAQIRSEMKNRIRHGLAAELTCDELHVIILELQMQVSNRCGQLTSVYKELDASREQLAGVNKELDTSNKQVRVLTEKLLMEMGRMQAVCKNLDTSQEQVHTLTEKLNEYKTRMIVKDASEEQVRILTEKLNARETQMVVVEKELKEFTACHIFEHLPDEVLYNYILPKLLPWELKRLMQVNKYFYDLIKDYCGSLARLLRRIPHGGYANYPKATTVIISPYETPSGTSYFYANLHSIKYGKKYNALVLTFRFSKKSRALMKSAHPLKDKEVTVPTDRREIRLRYISKSGKSKAYCKDKFKGCTNWKNTKSWRKCLTWTGKKNRDISTSVYLDKLRAKNAAEHAFLSSSVDRWYLHQY